MKSLFVAILFSTFNASSLLAGGLGDTPGTQINFSTPSRNVNCAFLHGENILWCERSKPKFATVQIANPVDWQKQQGMQFLVNEKQDFILAYGKSWTTPDGAITCKSKSSGLTCKLKNSFGFFMSKSRVSSFDSNGHEI